MSPSSSPPAVRLAAPLLAAALVLAATLVAACSSAGPVAGGPAPTAPATLRSAPTEEPTATPAPTATPTAAPTPTATPPPAPAVTVEPVDGSGLAALQIDGLASGPATIVVDGVGRAAIEVSEQRQPLVWVPAGTHEVCVHPTADGAITAWGASSAADDVVSTQALACTAAEGTVDARAVLLPGPLVVAHYGTGASGSLGVLGEGTPEAALSRVVAAAADYEALGLEVVPAFEFIVTVATAAPGADDSYSLPRAPEEVAPYLDLIRSVGGIMVLDFQPGRNSFIDQVRAYETLLREPDVHLALDPEWAMDADEVPGRVIGNTTGADVNEVLAYAGELVTRHGLPQKLVLVHQFTPSMVEDRDVIAAPPGVAVMIHVDGQGLVEAKYNTYDQLSVAPPWLNGFKVFFDEDSRVLEPREVLALEPRPDYVSYQ